MQTGGGLAVRSALLYVDRRYRSDFKIYMALDVVWV